MPLQEKYRPTTLDELYGNKAVKESVKAMFENRKREDLPHAFLFIGERGCGKTTMGRIIGTMLDCPLDEIIELNVANLRGVENVRSIIDSSLYSTLTGSPRVYIFDEIHQQTTDAKNALLKFLEEPPKNVYSILCTTNPEKLLDTMISRCHVYHMKALKPTEMLELINDVLEKEGFDTKDYPDTIKKEICRLSDGHPRDALKLLDAIIDMGDEESALGALANVDLTEVNGKEIFNALLNGDSWESIRKNVQQLIKDNDPEKVRRALLGYMKNVLYNSKRNDRASKIIDVFDRNTYDSGEATLVNMFYFVSSQK